MNKQLLSLILRTVFAYLMVAAFSVEAQAANERPPNVVNPEVLS